MQASERSSHPEGPQDRADRILAELLGTAADLRTPEGRAEAIRRIDSLPEEGEADPKSQPEPGTEAFEEISPEDTRNAWQAARSLCAAVQLREALKILDALEPLPDREGANLSATLPTDGFQDLKRRIRTEIEGLLDEMKGAADPGAIANRFRALLTGYDALFERLKGAGRYYDPHVVTRNEERSVVRYMAARAFVGQLCTFTLACDPPTEDPQDVGTSVGRDLCLLDRRLRCIHDLAGDISRELEAEGVQEGCGVAVLPGINFGKDPPPTDELLSLLTRSERNSRRWADSIARDGRSGAIAIRSEVDRLNEKAQAFRPVGTQPKTERAERLARLLTSFAYEYEQASETLAKLLP